MKRTSKLFIISLIFCILAAGCGNKEAKLEEEKEEIKQVIVDEITDYSVLSEHELEVLGYDGDVKAMLELGQLFEFGNEEVNQNFSEAMKWYEMAMAAGSPEGSCALGYFYLNGIGTREDVKYACLLFDEAIAAGNVNASVGKARCLLKELDDLDIAYPKELVEDAKAEDEEQDSPAEAAAMISEIYELVRVACVQLDVDGTYYMGYLHEKGIGCDVNLPLAIRYYESASAYEPKSVRDNFAINSANVALGLIYLKSTDAEPDYEKSLEYFTKAYDNNYAPAAYYLGQIYENGIGRDKDYKKAMEYYLTAAQAQYAPALNQIGYLYYNGYGVDVDFASAVYYQKLAALQGYGPAQINLGFLYENGFGVERNLSTALSYYELAAKAGYDGADDAVVRVTAQINEEN